MRTIKKVKDMQYCVRKLKQEGKTIAFVPTMGALHEGHLSLMRKARLDCDELIVSIYVNPSQFAPGEDYQRYPRNYDQDVKLAAGVGVNILFVPTDDEMYPHMFKTTVNVSDLSEKLCGASRPRHFQGVCTVVLKFFNIILPDRAYFGQKDAQQALIIKRMVTDLNLAVKIVVLPIIRDKDGLALSSRNSYLSPAERQAATVLYKSLQLARRLIKTGERRSEVIKQQMEELIKSENLIRLEYITICDHKTMTPVNTVDSHSLIALAANVGLTRLIDNYLVE
jgi:pantoate--beta-alanine ligase